eukprot:jgi/Mesvir1/17018/Mv25870-RA.2
MAASNIMMNSLCASRSALFPQSNLTDKSIFGGQKLRAAKRVVPPKCSGFIGQPTYPAKQANTRRGPASSQRILTVSGPAQTPAVPLLQRPSWSDVEFENDVTIYWDPAKVTAGAMTRIDYAPAEGSYDKRRDLLLVAGINGMGPSFAQIGHSVERGNTDRTIFEFTLRQVPADCATLDFFITDGHTVDDNGGAMYHIACSGFLGRPPVYDVAQVALMREGFGTYKQQLLQLMKGFEEADTDGDDLILDRIALKLVLDKAENVTQDEVQEDLADLKAARRNKTSPDSTSLVEFLRIHFDLEFLSFDEGKEGLDLLQDDVKAVRVPAHMLPVACVFRVGIST